ncbi:MAG: Asp23/Gls24 family envelope stress response protein [Candidatus Omnitrophota bacterium]|nr:Asp23/Gls24 family envelope stress response protein [Candidatus Omnitrophota bacterium]MDZ4241747.1 Asp23/Gls24 family envelope stress response protein [Candidatus Omnitrophota bacterium]
MREDHKGEFGAIKIHRKVIAEIAASAVNEIEGVSVITRNTWTGFLDLVGVKRHPGVVVSIDKSNQVTIEVKIKVRYGLHVPDVGRQIQDAVRSAVENTVDVDLKDVHVNVQGIERTETSSSNS